MSNAQTFLDLFNQLEQLLDEMNHSTEHYGFRRLVENLSKRNKLVNNFKVQLIEYNELRNAIVHKSTGRPIAEPYPEVVGEMQHMLDVLSRPPLAVDIATSPVYTCTTQTTLKELVTQMSQNHYTSIPVYHDDRFVGVFSDNSVTKYLANTKQAIDLDSTLVSQVLECCDDPNGKNNAYQFVDKHTDAYTVRDEFMKFTREKKRLGAIFITEHGDKNEDIVGIITPLDLPKIEE